MRPERGAGSASEAPILLYGHHAVTAALSNPERPCIRLHATENALQRIQPSLNARPGLLVETVSVRELDRILVEDAVHQGVVLEAGALPDRELGTLIADPSTPALVVILDHVVDPRNLGAILRSAAALGVAAVVVPRRGGPPLGGACAKAASGALDIVSIIEVANLGQAMQQLKAAGFWLIGLDGNSPTQLEQIVVAPRRALVLGSEGKGLRRLTADRCDFLGALRISGSVDSYNVAVAAGIALYILSMDRASEPG